LLYKTILIFFQKEEKRMLMLVEKGIHVHILRTSLANEE
jgi:hypothetical protein